MRENFILPLLQAPEFLLVFILRPADRWLSLSAQNSFSTASLVFGTPRLQAALRLGKWPSQVKGKHKAGIEPSERTVSQSRSEFTYEFDILLSVVGPECPLWVQAV